MIDEPNPKALIEQIRELESWDLADYDYQIGLYDSAKLTLELTWNDGVDTSDDDPDEDTAVVNVYDTVDDLEDTSQAGAPVDQVINQAADDTDLTTEEVSTEVERLKRKGELYEPRPDFLRTT